MIELVRAGRSPEDFAREFEPTAQSIGIFAALAEFERALIVERTKAGIAAACARGRNGGGRRSR